MITTVEVACDEPCCRCPQEKKARAGTTIVKRRILFCFNIFIGVVIFIRFYENLIRTSLPKTLVKIQQIIHNRLLSRQ
jgi:hypothetical protein